MSNSLPTERLGMTRKVKGTLGTGYVLPCGCVTKLIRKGSIEHKLVSHGHEHGPRGEAAPNPWKAKPVKKAKKHEDSPKLLAAIRAEISRRSAAKEFPFT